MTKTLCNDFKAKAKLSFSCSSIVLKCWDLYQAFFVLAFIISFGVELAKYYQVKKIGAIFDVTSPFGKEEKTAMEIAVQSFNISLFMNPGRDLLIAAITAEKPDKEMNKWEKRASVAAIGNHVDTLVLSYAAPSTPPTLSSLDQPFFAKLTINDFEQMKCFAAIVHVYSWNRVIPIFEEEEYLAFILKSSYTAKASLILIFQPLEPNITDIERLRKANSKIGFDGDSFVRAYLEGLLRSGKQHIENVSSKYKYEGEFRSINRAAAFLELQDGKVFLSQYRKQFIATTPIYSFRGLGFVFKIGSPIATDISKAILNLNEDRILKALQEKRFAYSSEVSYSLAMQSFWGTYLIFGATSTVCVLLFLVNLIKNYCCDQDGENEDNIPPC